MLSLPEITRQVFEAFQPTLEVLQAEVSRHPNFAVVNSGLLEDLPFVAAIGLVCERTDGRLPEVTFGIGCLVVRHSEATHAMISAEVVWSHSAALGGSDGFSIYEAMTPPLRYVDVSTVNSFAGRFPRLRDAFRRGLAHGRPPSRLGSLWLQLFHGCPAPDHYTLDNQMTPGDSFASALRYFSAAGLTTGGRS
jgi:hypothetical protein